VLEGVKGANSTSGPLTRRIAETGLQATSTIPLLGDAAPGDVDEATLLRTIEWDEDSVDDLWATAIGTKGKKLWIPEGALLTEAMNDGPAFWNGTDAVSLIASNGAELSNQIACDTRQQCAQPLGPAGTAETNSYLQDTRDWFAVHGGGRNSSANILMVDGAVKTFYDQQGDRFLNPGFPVAGAGVTPDSIPAIGYSDEKVELSPGEIFNGVFLFRLTKGKFEP